jgi:hypothetical protein
MPNLHTIYSTWAPGGPGVLQIVYGSHMQFWRGRMRAWRRFWRPGGNFWSLQGWIWRSPGLIFWGCHLKRLPTRTHTHANTYAHTHTHTLTHTPISELGGGGVPPWGPSMESPKNRFWALLATIWHRFGAARSNLDEFWAPWARFFIDLGSILPLFSSGSSVAFANNR